MLSPARRGDRRAFRRRDGNRRAHRQRHADQRHRCRAAGTGRGAARRRRCSTAATARAIRSSAAVWQGRAGVARHDAVAWGYARAADAARRRHHPELRGDRLHHRGRPLRRRRDRRKATIRAGQRRHSRWPAIPACWRPKAGFDLPIHSYSLQAMVSEPVKPCLDTVVLSLGTGTYLSASRTRARSSSAAASTACLPMRSAAICRCSRPSSPACSKCSRPSAQLKLMRQWAGIVDVVPDSSPIIGPSPLPGLYLNCGWGTGGFKAIPAGGWLLAHLIATGSHHEISRPFDLDRFATRPPDRRGGRLRHRALRGRICSFFPAPSAVRATRPNSTSAAKPARCGPSRQRGHARALVDIPLQQRQPQGRDARDLGAPDLRRVLPDGARHGLARGRTARESLRGGRAHERARGSGGAIDRSRHKLHASTAATSRLRRRHDRLGAAGQRRRASSAAASNITGRAASGAPGPRSRTRWSTSRSRAGRRRTCARRPSRWSTAWW